MIKLTLSTDGQRFAWIHPMRILRVVPPRPFSHPDEVACKEQGYSQGPVTWFNRWNDETEVDEIVPGLAKSMVIVDNGHPPAGVAYQALETPEQIAAMVKEATRYVEIKA